MSNDERPPSTVTPDEVGAAAVAFMEGLTAAFGAQGDVAVQIDGIELDVVSGKARSGQHSVYHVISFEVRGGDLVEVSQRNVTPANMR